MSDFYIGDNLLLHVKRDDSSSSSSSSESKSSSSSATTSSPSSSSSSTTSSSSSTSKSSGSSPSSSSKSNSKTSSSSSVSKSDLPSATSSTTSKSSKSSSAGNKLPTLSSSYTIPTVSVPANNNNPFIHRSSEPSGTVFIAFAAVLALGLIIIALVWYYATAASRKNAKKRFFDSNNTQTYFGGEKDYQNAENSSNLNPFATQSNFHTTPYHSRNNSELALGNIKSNNNASNRVSMISMDNLMSIGNRKSQGDLEDLLDNNNNNNNSTNNLGVSDKRNNRSSLFISPTAELLNSKRKSAQNFEGMDSLQPTAENDSTLDPNLSEISVPAKADLSPSLPGNQGSRRSRATPSMFLENMFDKDDLNNLRNY